MPQSALHTCPRCDRLVRGTCGCRQQARPSAAERGYTPVWTAYSKQKAAGKRCVRCGEPAEFLDHITAHKGDPALFWDSANHQPICGTCNRRKCVESEGGFGR